MSWITPPPASAGGGCREAAGGGLAAARPQPPGLSFPDSDVKEPSRAHNAPLHLYPPCAPFARTIAKPGRDRPAQPPPRPGEEILNFPCKRAAANAAGRAQNVQPSGQEEDWLPSGRQCRPAAGWYVQDPVDSRRARRNILTIHAGRLIYT